jgi:hypothetical protein
MQRRNKQQQLNWRDSSRRQTTTRSSPSTNKSITRSTQTTIDTLLATQLHLNRCLKSRVWLVARSFRFCERARSEMAPAQKSAVSTKPQQLAHLTQSAMKICFELCRYRFVDKAIYASERAGVSNWARPRSDSP